MYKFAVNCCERFSDPIILRRRAIRASPPMDPNTQTPKRGTVLPNGHWRL